MQAFNALVKKEWRQNALIYLLPYLAVLIVWILLKRQIFTLSLKWTEIIVSAVPLTLAVSYGLQIFDLEENGQTRDYLLTKPLSIKEIIWAKYLSGLSVLIAAAVLWFFALEPDALKIPSLSDYSTFWFISYMLLLINVYTVCFTTGIFVKGPIKFLIGTLFSMALAGWFFYTLFQFLTFIFRSEGGARRSIWAIWAADGFCLCFGTFTVAFFKDLAEWILQNIPAQNLRRKIAAYAAVAMLLPLLFTGVNSFTAPAVSPFNSLAMSLLGYEEWFVATEGSRRPGGDLYAFSDARGRLALARRGEKPDVIYESPSGKPLSGLAWSFDGRVLAFKENRKIMAINVENRISCAVGEGDLAFWANNGNRMIIAKKIPGDPKGNSAGRGKGSVYELALYDYDMDRMGRLGSVITGGSSLAWDSANNRLLAVDSSWRLVLMDIKSGKIQFINILPPGQSPEVIFESGIFPLKGYKSYTIAVFTLSRKAFRKKEKVYNVFLYDYLPARSIITRVSVLDGVNYEELLPGERGIKTVGRIGNGVYRSVRDPREVWSND
ncbi:MAG: hypothetical protein ACM3WV_07875 [Bacillota bacterium]